MGEQSPPASKSKRLTGLDMARFLAFAGMVFVNFHVVMGSPHGVAPIDWFLVTLEGKAAATFVVLAGIGLGLGAARTGWRALAPTIWKRAGFLMIAGLVNSLIFPADILHYYAVYFAVGIFLVPLSTRVLWLLVVALPLAFVALVMVFDYETGWNWATLSYADFWTPGGFARNLMFNGWHPVVPWLGFFALGLALARLDLARTATQIRIAVFGAAALVLAHELSRMGSGGDPDLALMTGLSPIPPMPLYMLAGSGTAALVIGVCLLAFADISLENSAGWRPFLLAGRQALTLYLAHIIIGMGILEAAGLLSGQTVVTSFLAAALFAGLSVVYAWGWSKMNRRGPAEALMRRLAG